MSDGPTPGPGHCGSCRHWQPVPYMKLVWGYCHLPVYDRRNWYVLHQSMKRLETHRCFGCVVWEAAEDADES